MIACLSMAVIFEYIGFLKPLTPCVASKLSVGAAGPNDAESKDGTGVGVFGKFAANALAKRT